MTRPIDHLTDRLSRLRRPSLLMQAARIAAAGYRRDTHLPRWLDTPLPATHLALAQLMTLEEEVNVARLIAATGYRPSTHVGLMTAILGELHLARESETAAPREEGTAVRDWPSRSGAPRAPVRAQLNASGIEALRSATNASSASTVAGSIGGC